MCAFPVLRNTLDLVFHCFTGFSGVGMSHTYFTSLFATKIARLMPGKGQQQGVAGIVAVWRCHVRMTFRMPSGQITEVKDKYVNVFGNSRKFKIFAGNF